MPEKLSEISAKQALELLFLLSRINVPQNSSTPKLTEVSEDQTEVIGETLPVESALGNITIHEETVDISQDNTTPPIKTEVTNQDSDSEVLKLPEESPKDLSQIDMTKITEEICHAKMSELKRLLTTAQSAVSSMANSQEDLSEKLATPKVENIDNPEVSGGDVWITPTTSRSNSESKDRAGRYNKKQAPKAPVSSGHDDPEEAESQQALKATLVIKSGTVKTLTNIDNAAKTVFINHPASSSSSSSGTKKKRKVKEGLSKFLAIPKNLFHTTFHKDQRDELGKVDAGSIARSRSTSVDLQDNNINLKTDTPEPSENSDAREIPSAGSLGSYQELRESEMRDIKKRDCGLDRRPFFTTNICYVSSSNLQI